MDVFDDKMRASTMDNIAGGLSQCRQDIIDRMIALFTKVHADYGNGIAARIAKIKS